MTEVDREFCPPSQLRRGMMGLQFKPSAKARQKIKNDRPSPSKEEASPRVSSVTDSRRSSDTSSINTSNNSSLPDHPSPSPRSTKDDSDYEPLPLNEEKKSKPKHEKCPSWPEPMHAKGSNDKKVWSANNRGLISNTSASERSQSWVWNEQDIAQHSIHDSKSVSKKPISQDSGIGEELSTQVFRARYDRRQDLTSDLCEVDHSKDWFGSDNSQLLIVQADNTSLSTEHSPQDNTSSSVSEESPRKESQKMVPIDPLEYDSDTIRRSAQKNREISRKLFLQMNLKMGQKSPRSGRALIKSPSQLSTSGTSSSASSSGIGTLRSSIYASINDQEDPVTKNLLCRSQSSDNFLHLPANGPEISPQHWNTPHQRRNILSMVEFDNSDTHSTSSSISTNEMPREKSLPYAPAEHTGGILRTLSSVAANRGVSKKISSKRRAAREAEEQQRSMLRSMPDLNQMSTPTSSDSVFGSSAFQPYDAPGYQDYLSLSTCQSNKSENQIQRSISPIYAMPEKSNHKKQLSADDSSLLRNSGLETNMKSPPPLPRKPPPRLDQTRGDGLLLSQLPQTKYVSTPCLQLSDIASKKEKPDVDLSNSVDMTSSNPSVWSRTVHSQPVSAPQAQSPITISQNSIITGGKPTVQVHPYVPSCEPRQTLNISVPGDRKLTSKSPSPRPPPVPKKPNYLMSPPKPRIRQSKQETADHREKLNSVEQTCNRLSKLVSENDKSLEGILNSQPPVSSKVVRDLDGYFDSTISINTNSPSNGIVRRGSNSKPSDISPTSERVLKGLYGKGASSSSTSLSSISVQQNGDLHDLETKKSELINSLSGKLKILEEVQKSLEDEIEMNERLGQSIAESYAQSGATDHQMAKFRLHVEEMEKITCLLLKLHAQLGRVKNALNTISSDASPKEKKMLKERHQRLVSKLEDANGLRENLNRREETVLFGLEQLLPAEIVADYKHFLHEKTNLLAEAREVEEKLTLGQDQLNALELSLSVSSHLTIDQS